MMGSSTSPTFEAIRGERCPHCDAAPGEPCQAAGGPLAAKRVIQFRSHHRARILAARMRAEAARRAADMLNRP
jgi:hypothetical protein